MKIGIPKEIKANEQRVALIPTDVQRLKEQNIEVYIETNAGLLSGYSDADYISSGAKICKTKADLYNIANIIVKVKEPLEPEYNLITEKHTVFAFFHFASSPTLLQSMKESKATCIAYETIQDENKKFPILAPMSIIAGQQAIKAAKQIRNQPNYENEIVTILGVGNVGRAAAYMAKEMGYKHINLVDKDYDKLRPFEDEGFSIYEMTNLNLTFLLNKSKIIVGSIYMTGEKATKLISKRMLDVLQKDLLIMDVAIDQGGITDLSSPTTISNPLIEYKNVKIYCVPNIPSTVPSDASSKLSNAIYPYLVNFINSNINEISPELKTGVNIYHGELFHESLKNIV